MEFEGLINIDDISRKKVSEKASSVIKKTIKTNELVKYLSDGWEHADNNLKTREKVFKPKRHSSAFEDRIWALLAKLEFKYINSYDNFNLEYEPGISKQIDAFGLDEEVALVFECKSSPSRKRVNYRLEINELIGIKEKIRAKIRNSYGRNYKVAFIFTTNNSILGKNDRERLKNENIWHFNQDDIEYFETLSEHLGSAAKYQLFGRLFAGQKVPGIKNRVPAIKGKMCSGETFYSFSIEPEFLLKVGFILHRFETTLDTAKAYQRLVKKPRLIDIGKYIDNGNYFPNSVIVNIETKRDKDLKFEPAPNEHDSSTELGVLYLPQVYKSAFIIDGQHRLYGYSRANNSQGHLLPVVAFHNLPHEIQSQIFIDINHKQKSVPANLLRSLMAEFHWESEDASHAIAALKTRILSDMNYDERSPLYKKIILSEEKKSDFRCLTLQTLISWGFGKTDFFGKTKSGKLIKTGTLWDGNYQSTLEKSIDFFNLCLLKFEEDLTHQWNLGSSDGGFISMNNGITGILRIINDILNHLIKENGINPEEMPADALAEAISPFLDSVVTFVENLDSEGLRKLRSLFGGGAPEKIQREFQNAINSEYPNFQPDGLEQWKKEHSGQFNAQCFDIGVYIEKDLIDGTIRRYLRDKYGEEGWWFEGVPIKIQKECSSRRIEKKSREHDSNFLDLIDYRSIITNNWDIFGETFTPNGLENKSREKKTDWLVQFNSIRQKYSHPQRENTTEDEYLFLLNTKNWLEEVLLT